MPSPMDRQPFPMTPQPVPSPRVPPDPGESPATTPAEPVPPATPESTTPVARRLPFRQNRGINRKYADFYSHPALAKGDGFLQRLDWDRVPTTSTGRAMTFLAKLTYNYRLDLEAVPYPTAMAVKANDADTPTYAEAMASSDAEGFRAAMDKEIAELVQKKAWDLVPKSVAVKARKKVLGSTWAFRRKRYPDGSLRKLKARICVRGDQQVMGVDVFDTFAPVISWSVVRLVLSLAVAFSWSTAQVDYANAFVQAKLDEPVFIACPREYEVPGHVLLLKRSLYGLRESPLNWFNALCEGLRAQGFEPPSQREPCLFIKKNVMVLVYVDDCIFVSNDSRNIDREINKLKGRFDLDREDDMAGFLGVAIDTDQYGHKVLTQTGLIDRVLLLLGLEASKAKDTPAAYGALDSDPDGEERIDTWNYRSAIGMLLYLASNTRPEITFAVNQCARFAANPTRKHEEAVKRIGRYLKGTRKKGLIMAPTKKVQLDLWVDADFAGLWGHESPDSPMSVYSRTGYVITLGNVPIIWKSKLQTEIALSTMEAEYIAASTAMRELLPLRETFASVTTAMDIPNVPVSTASSVWEDNEACWAMMNAPLPKMTPRTKHIGIKYHWFRQHLGPKTIVPRKVRTENQKADIFTKGLRTELFVKHRRTLMGW